MTNTTGTTRELRQQLVAGLQAEGRLTSPGWVEAFAATPREIFAPAVFTMTPQGQRGPILSAADPQQREAYLTLVYSDDAIVTQVAPDGTVTSSSTQPGVMASMLEALDIADGQQVLEIGTGTGYNAGLLCHRLSDQSVISIDIDAGIVDAARAALSQCGHQPTVVAGDGLEGFLPGAPFDRIIATCSTARIPAAWLAQTRPGGIVLANIGVGVIPLHIDEDHTGSGRFLADVAAFIMARQVDGPAGMTVNEILEAAASHDAPHVTAGGAEFDEFRDPEFEAYREIANPGVHWCGLLPEGEIIQCLAERGGSWARAHQIGGDVRVHQHGPRRLWDEVAGAHRRWVAAGRPSHDRLGLTVTTTGVHTLWVDEPNASHRWPLH